MKMAPETGNSSGAGADAPVPEFGVDGPPVTEGMEVPASVSPSEAPEGGRLRWPYAAAAAALLLAAGGGAVWLLHDGGREAEAPSPDEHITAPAADASDSGSAVANPPQEAAKFSGPFIEVLHQWSALHKAGAAGEFEKVYAPIVSYYGSSFSRGQCIGSKARLLTRDFSQSILFEEAARLADGSVGVSFIKKVHTNGLDLQFPAYLVLRKMAGRWLIIKESDFVTDFDLSKGSPLGSFTLCGDLGTDSASFILERRTDGVIAGRNQREPDMLLSGREDAEGNLTLGSFNAGRTQARIYRLKKGPGGRFCGRDFEIDNEAGGNEVVADVFLTLLQ